VDVGISHRDRWPDKDVLVATYVNGAGEAESHRQVDLPTCCTLKGHGPRWDLPLQGMAKGMSGLAIAIDNPAKTY